MPGVVRWGTVCEALGQRVRGRDDVDQPVALVERRAARVRRPKQYGCAVEVSASSTWAGVAAGESWNSWATMPATCGAAIDVPLIVL